MGYDFLGKEEDRLAVGMVCDCCCVVGGAGDRLHGRLHHGDDDQDPRPRLRPAQGTVPQHLEQYAVPD